MRRVFEACSESESAWLESAGHSLGLSLNDKEMQAYLKREVLEATRQLIEESRKVARHCLRRATISVTDVNTVLRRRSLPPVDGTAVDFRRVALKTGRDLVVAKDSIVTISSLGSVRRPLPNTLAVYWLAIDGRTVLDCHRAEGSAEMSSALSELSKRKSIVVKKSRKKRRVVIRAKDKVPHSLSKEQQMVFEVLCNALCQSDCDALEKVCGLLRDTDAGLSALVPHITALLAKRVSEHPLDLWSNFGCVALCDALVCSRYLRGYLEPYLHQLCKVLLTCCVRDALAVDTTDRHWQLRVVSGLVLRKVADYFSTKYPMVKAKVINTCAKRLSQFGSQPLPVTYGCVATLMALGPTVVSQQFASGIADAILEYTSHLQTDETNSDLIYEIKMLTDIIQKATVFSADIADCGAESPSGDSSALS